ncbi:MAG: hypothetical protein AAB722_01425 [Patescibacteria group bacterium]
MSKFLNPKKVPSSKFQVPRFSGFTLVETVLYVGVLGILLVVISNLILGTTGNYKTASIKDELASSAYQVFGFFFREVKNAGSIYLSGSVLDSDSGSLSLLTPFQFGGASAGKVDFYLSGGRVMFRREGETELALTPESIEVIKFKFIRVTPKVGLEGVRFYLDIKNRIKPEEIFSLTTFTVLRGGYVQ